MRKIICILLVGGLFLSCTSSKKLLEKGRYEKAINKSADELRENPGNNEELRVLKEAYYQANRIDKERIDFLEKEDRDKNWIEIYNLYLRLDNRQNKIEVLPPRVRQEFTFVDYDDVIINSKSAAASVSYNKGLELLEKGDKYSAREAYYEFEQAYNIYPDYRKVTQKLEEAQYKGINHVLFRIENNSEKVLPADFDAELRKMPLKELNGQWLNFDTYSDTTKSYDYFVILNIRDIEVSPEQIETEKYTESKEIQDGMRYVLDEDGNVKKDSLGNDIREPNIVRVSAEVEETVQRKAAIVGGSIDYINLYDNELIKTDKVLVEARFNHYSARVAGNPKALSKESRSKVESQRVPFPSNEQILMDASFLLKEKAKAIIAQNREVLER